MMKKLKRLNKELTPYEKIKLIFMIFIIGLLLMLVAKFLFVGEPEVHETPVGEYTCKGGLIKVCTGSKEVADYLGV